MEVPEIAAQVLKTIEPVDPLKCPTCGEKMELVLVGKVNPVWVTLCKTVTIKHPTWVCTPNLHF